MTATPRSKPTASEKTETGDSAPDRLSPAEVRKAAGLSAAEMAGILGMSTFGYDRWEAGTRTPGGPAHRLLHLIDRDGQTVIDALQKISD